MTDFTDQPLGLLCEVTRRELVHLLESLPGQKDLVVDATILRPLDKVASMSLLQNHGCSRVLPLRADSVLSWDPDINRRIYILRSSLEMARLVSHHVRASPDKQVAVIWVGRRLSICDRQLETQGVYGIVETYELPMCLLPIENDLFSLELPVTYPADLYQAAHSLFQLQSLYGLIPTVYGLGEQSNKMWKLLRHLYVEKGEPRASPDQPISHLFVFDRSLDPASVLMTGLTYEAMLHDVFTIGCGKISFGPEVQSRMKADPHAKEGEPYKHKVFVLDNNDGVFASVRNKHMTGVFPFLSSKAKEIQSTYDKGASIDQVQDMKQFVSNELKFLKQQHRQLEMHICACEVLLEKNNSIGASERLRYEQELVSGTANVNEVITYLEECALRNQSPWSVLALICLASVTNNGLPSKGYHSFREHFLRAYGYDFLPVLHSLQSRKLFFEKSKPAVGNIVQSAIPSIHAGTPSDPSPTFAFLSKRLNLTPSSEDVGVDLRNPNKMSYVFSGVFTPPFCQIVSDSMVHGWNTNEMKKTFGHVLVEENSYTPADGRPDNRMKKAILVFFLGGVTYAEVAALRLLAVQNNFRILVATTNIIHREQFLRLNRFKNSLYSGLIVKNKPRVYTKFGSDLYCRIHKHLDLLHEKYTPSWWCPFGTLMSIFRHMFRECPTLPFDREVVTLSDSGVVAIDWMNPKESNDESPIFVFLPGITGSTHESSYILHCVLEALDHNWKSVVVNPRGLGGVPLKTKQTYNACYSGDIEQVLQLITERFPKAKKIGCGFSMGGMILGNYMAKKTASDVNINAAMIISSPFDPHASTESLEAPLPRFLFNHHLAETLVNIVKPHRHLFEDVMDFDKLSEVKTIRHFDTLFTTPVFGYRDCREYYEDAALCRKADRIPVPTICLNSVDDVFAPIASIPFDVISKSETVISVITSHGGHTAFMEHWNPKERGLVEKLLYQWGNMIFNDLH
ncbi:unnamed protein product [Auanema sp. JU1783]|nr:unnamed protein product [Auanema sp. JU1783]